ncbi:MAG: single-stranded-DNA-specific exonuclease RecJ [Phycisphaerae bacterium]
MARARKKKNTKERLWVVRDVEQAALRRLCDDLGVSEVVAKVLLNRDIAQSEQASNFMRPSLKELVPPEKLSGMVAAVERVAAALESREKIAIYGDYDVDGITATSILCRLFSLLKADYIYYIPDRIEDGYGLNTASIEELAQCGVKLIITVDCGVTALNEVTMANKLGVDVVITDHHRFGEQLPEACAIVHPMFDDYPSPNSCGAMVAMKLAWGICNRYRGSGLSDEQCKQYLLIASDFAALGTVADVMPLQGENRALVSYCLSSIPLSAVPGFIAAIHTAGLRNKQRFETFDLSFRLVPMLNAAGRLGSARLAVELLTTDSLQNAMQIAGALKKQNEGRKKIEKDIFAEAQTIVKQMGLDSPEVKSIVIASADWHPGVVGIVASRLVETYFKPSILLCVKDGVAKGSARTIQGFNLYCAIASAEKYLNGFGGHSEAAGLSLDMEHLPNFAEAFEEYAKEHTTEDMLVERLELDGIFKIRDFDGNTLERLERFGPYGKGNPKPVFATKGVHIIGQPVKMGSGNEHIRFVIRDSTGEMGCVGFNMGSLHKKLLEAEFFSIAYETGINEYNGRRSPQFIVRDINFDS